MNAISHSYRTDKPVLVREHMRRKPTIYAQTPTPPPTQNKAPLATSGADWEVISMRYLRETCPDLQIVRYFMRLDRPKKPLDTWLVRRSPGSAMALAFAPA